MRPLLIGCIDLENAILRKDMNPITAAVRLTSRAFARKLSSAAKEEKVKLPQLPVPKLQDTLNKYLKSVKPFLNNDELKDTEQVVKEFGVPGGVGEELQCILEEKAKTTLNWLEDWWLKVAYLEFRQPVVYYSSPGLVFPQQKFKSLDDQISYASKLVRAAVDYKLVIDEHKIPQEKMGKHPLDMSQYSKIFGTNRFPCKPGDKLQFSPISKHIVVIHNNHFFKMNVITDKGSAVSDKIIKTYLEDIVCQSKDKAPAVGILSADHRDTWADSYQKLVKHEANKTILDVLATSLFTLSLDKCCYNPSGLLGCKLDHMTVAGFLTINGSGSEHNTGNRWFDKTIQFVVDSKGHNGLTYEHSPAEGQPIAVMMDYVVKQLADGKTSETTEETSKPEHMEFVITNEIDHAISNSEQYADNLTKEMEIECFKFTDFGKEFIKSQKLSPDSFIQMAIQYAFYRIHNEPGAHYESAATRMFIHGRTETIRSCSVESIEFCKKMLDSSASGAVKVNALKTAITAHKDYTNQALQGLGVDRHLLGLKLVALENNIPLPELYNDVSYKRSTHMRISTSQVASKCDGFMVYGPIVNDGYACCYNPRANDINFGTSAFKSCPTTNAQNWKEAIIQSLRDMKTVLEQTPQAKL